MSKQAAAVKGMELHHVDIQDVDGSWFRGVAVYIDHATGDFYLPMESFCLLDGELADDDTGESYLLDGSVLATGIELPCADGSTIAAWEVAPALLTIRPSKKGA